MRRGIASLCLHGALLAVAAVTIFPFVWMLLSSFKSADEISAVDQHLLPHVWTLENYRSIQENFDAVRLLGNSLMLSIVITAIAVYTSLLGGYVFGKYRFRGRGALFAVVLATMMIPWAVVLIPRYTMFTGAGLQDSYASIVIPAAISSFGIFMMRQSMDNVPDEILEAARIDGASELYIFHRIVAPMSVNAISALAIFQFLWVWEDYLWPYLMLSTPSKQVLAVGLTTFSGQYSTDYGGLFAATTVSIVPVVIVYVIFQKRFIAGAASAAVKG
ncbi:carbohydrate ABC transporter permease [Amorphoplanes digitatis]|uniref:Multiple sugar transport system permease protein/raffinose/stachyose/melibiose transport system permease protein n=1 Tax=Actinoplanes digitatis TaxID=1868 RepID=A0A7W7MPU6_9ACTN|nr:carbohydrate ABC transporter permease [Actinoplanes digitatis]MBB4761749.1 multiple sugar transport system permease protein/raffinose/stachyose/melibiose transport system permease protein [Actinoplanes digitatis]BFE70359.1 carbohydrate ABC transporter permease [Actinoplanes digitatis]GID90860.1 sugar ABC transporter permease [Actinoplanes digitatis]